MNVAARKIEPPKTPSLHEMAQEALREANNDIPSAIAALVNSLLNDKRLLKEVVAAVVVTAAREHVSSVMREQRRIIIGRDKKGGQMNVTALAAGLADAMLNFPLIGGLLLRQATRDQVVAQAEVYEGQSRSMSHKARWLRLIAQGLEPEKFVGDVLTEQRAKELWQEASNVV